MKIISWNVLHIIHELNHVFNDSPVLDKYLRNEVKRLTDIFNAIKALMNENSVICLQEVPGDLLTLLKQLPNTTVFEYKYSRVPTIKYSRAPIRILKELEPIYDDPAEYLVTLVHQKHSATALQTIQFDDPGKACQVTQIGDTIVMNAHIPFGAQKRGKALSQIFQTVHNDFVRHTSVPFDAQKYKEQCARARAEQVLQNFVLVGDTNMRPDELRSELGSLILISIVDYGFWDCISDIDVVVEMDKETRKGRNKGTEYYSKIDHGVVSPNIKVSNKFVAENLDMSDHSIIQFDYE